MVVRVAEQARKSGAAEIVVATDHADIAAAVREHGHDVVMTRPDHASGTDRLAEVIARRRYRAGRTIVNVQGDEPLIAPALIRRVAESLERHPDAQVSTAACPLRDARDLANPNVVKVVVDREGYALYFSRAPIPYARDAFAQGIRELPRGLPVYRHLGIYGYRARFLRVFSGLPAPAIERFEALEQLRVLWHGHRISVAMSKTAPHAGIDTPQDLERVRRALGRRPRVS
jgi:3-deoxy-manno-octulosonate cytidylyltransferase (CMP-KDO synthetase)